MPTVNNGIVEVSAGTMTFHGGYTNPGGVISLAGATLQVAKALELAGGRLAGWGTV